MNLVLNMNGSSIAVKSPTHEIHTNATETLANLILP